MEPVPPVDPHQERSHDTQSRIDRIQSELNIFNGLSSNLMKAHPIEAMNAEECIPILSYDLASLEFPINFKATAYQEWLEGLDQIPHMEFHQRFLSLLSHPVAKDSRRTWLLKTPWHTNHVWELLQVYPNAKLIATHREPKGMMGSLCSVHSLMKAIFTDKLDMKELGKEQLRVWSKITKKFVTARQDNTMVDRSIHDIKFETLVKDPMSVVENLYNEYGWNLGPETKAAMQKLIDGKWKRGKHGKHVYSLEEYGLDTQLVNEAFADYCQAMDFDCTRNSTFKIGADYN